MVVVFASFSIFALQMKTREILARFQILSTYFTRSSIGIIVLVFYFIYRYLLNENLKTGQVIINSQS